MSWRHPATEQERRSRDEHQRKQLAALVARLDRQVGALRTGEDWAGALRQSARLPGQSFSNVLLIAAQRPGATMVAGYEAWKSLGRQVTRNQKGIAVLAETARPAAAGGAVASGGAGAASGGSDQVRRRLAYVWDISQTAGPAIPATGVSAARDDGVPVGLRDALTWAARREGFAVEREDCGGGPGDALIMWNARRIRVRPGLPGEREASAILHHLGHITMHGHLTDPPCATAGACDGILRLEADSVACIVGARHGIPVPDLFPPVANWAGAAPRANPELAVRAAGARITTAASRLSAHLAATLPVRGASPRPAQGPETPAQGLAIRVSDGRRQAAAVRARAEASVIATGPPATAAIPFSQVLADAERFYLAQAPDSWVPAYLRSRGLADQAIRDWRIGCAPAGWTALTDHLRDLGHASEEIVTAGLARNSSRGTLIDHFRDRAMFAVRDEHGSIAGYIGRARPGAGPAVPKYLNSPQTATYAKDEILLGLHLARPALASGAVPVLVEGPFDAVAITSCAPGQYAGLAVCGTALTGSQVAALSGLCDLDDRGVIVASDGDRAGRHSAIRAYDTLRAFTSRAISVTFPPGQDPAAVLQSGGPAALAAIMREQAQPLARLVIDAEIEQRLTGGDSPHQALIAMRGTAQVIAGLLPAGVAREITALTGGRTLRTWTDDLRPAHEPSVERIARMLPGDTVSQVVAVASRLGFDYSDVITEVANAVTWQACSPKRLSGRDRRPDLDRGATPVPGQVSDLAASSFPRHPVARHAPPSSRSAPAAGSTTPPVQRPLYARR